MRSTALCTAALVCAAIACRTSPSSSPPATAPPTRSSPPPSASRDIGDRCTADAECGAGATCVRYYTFTAGPDAPQSTCETPCTPGSSACGDGLTCQVVSDGPGTVCRPAQPLPALASYSREVRNLVAAGRAWGMVEHRHPRLSYRDDIDWDRAWIEAAPAIAAAESEAELATAVGSMLARLGDPSTRVVKAPTVPDGKATRWPRPGVLVVDLSRVADTGALTGELAKADAVVIDTRAVTDVSGGEYVLSQIGPMLVRTPTPAPSSRALQHWGYTPNTPRYAVYYSVMETVAPRTIEPAKDTKLRHTVFVVDPPWVPDLALALHRAKRAALVSSTPLTLARSGAVLSAPIGNGYQALIRTQDIVTDGRIVQPAADARATDPLAKAIEMASAKRLATRPLRGDPAPEPHSRQTRRYPSDDVPSPALRALAAIRFWHILDLYYGYPDLLEEWDAQLPRFVDRAWHADTREAYVDALRRMAAAVPDMHSRIHGALITQVVGDAWAPFEVRPVQGAVVVISVNPGVTAVRPGDVILAIEGRPIADAFAEQAPSVPAPTANAHRSRTIDRLFTGHADRPLHLTVSGADGAERKVEVARTKEWKEPTGTHYRRIGEDIGYANLDVLEGAEVGPMFEAFANTRGLILDLRGYPKGTAWVIGPRLNRHPDPTIAARFRTPLVVGDNPTRQRVSQSQSIPPYDGKPYPGKVVVLIDDRAISQSEHTCLFFEAATDVTFIGSPTTGSNGNVTDFCLPGDACGFLTGMEVRHADGRQLQRVGILPDVRVEPTVAGIRAGKDEVLERAIEYLRSGVP